MGGSPGCRKEDKHNEKEKHKEKVEHKEKDKNKAKTETKKKTKKKRQSLGTQDNGPQPDGRITRLYERRQTQIKRQNKEKVPVFKILHPNSDGRITRLFCKGQRQAQSDSEMWYSIQISFVQE